MNVVIIGAGGLLGNACLKCFNESSYINAIGTFRCEYNSKEFRHKRAQHYFLPDALEVEKLQLLFEDVQPSVIINCTSLSKDKLRNNNPLEMIPIYSVLPHTIADLCDKFSVRLVQISSDGVFSGSKGNYSEDDIPDASDLYGRAKLLGEVNCSSCINLRTSMVGHGPKLENGLVSWMLGQKGTCSGFPDALFSGFPVNTLAKIIRDYVLPEPEIHGLYHLASEPISKFDLLQLIVDIYDLNVTIIPDRSIKINRTLDAAKFKAKTSFISPSWSDMVVAMKNDHFNFSY